MCDLIENFNYDQSRISDSNGNPVFVVWKSSIQKGKHLPQKRL